MRPTINYTELKHCIRSDLLFFNPGDNGVTCHKSEVSQDYVCKWAGEWCYDSVIPTKCNAGIDSEDSCALIEHFGKIFHAMEPFRELPM